MINCILDTLLFSKTTGNRSKIFVTALSECLPQWANQRLVFTVFEVNNTWNEAREVCRNNERWLLSMDDSDAWSMWKHLM